MLTIPTDREFRDVAARVTLPAEEFIPEPASEGIWRHLPSAQEPNEHAQSLIELYNKVYHPIILAYYGKKGLSLSRKEGPESWTFALKSFYILPNQVAVMIIIRDPQITHHHDADQTTSEGVKTPASRKITDQALTNKLAEERQVAILKSRGDPPSRGPFNCEVGEILVLEGGNEGLQVRAGGIASRFIPYKIERKVEEQSPSGKEPTEAAVIS